MKTLLERMKQNMELKGFSPRTKECYHNYVKKFEQLITFFEYVERIDKTLGEVTYRNQKSYDASGNCIVEYEKNILDRETNKIERKFKGEGLLEEELK